MKRYEDPNITNTEKTRCFCRFFVGEIQICVLIPEQMNFGIPGIRNATGEKGEGGYEADTP